MDPAALPETVLANVVEQLDDAWVSDETGDVDVDATNTGSVLSGRRLEQFTAAQLEDPALLRAEDLGCAPLPAEHMAILLLGAGLGTRSGGQIHPLCEDPETGRTLIDLQLQRIAASPLRGAAKLILGSPLAQERWLAHLASYPQADRPRVLSSSIVAQMTTRQRRSQPSQRYRDASGRLSYNPAGHLEAVRGLVITGLLEDLRDCEVLFIASYSNWGLIFSDTTRIIAAHVARSTQAPGAPPFFVEVTRRSRAKATGSLLAWESVAGKRVLRLVKRAYGAGEPRRPDSGDVVMSTNSYYVSIPALRRQLAELDSLDPLRAAGTMRRQREVQALFDRTFPVRPYVSSRTTPDGIKVLQAERDLDQLTLLDPCPVRYIRVPQARGVSIKTPADLVDPDKRRYVVS